jgi:hypothetical protein
MATSVVSM